MYSIARSRKSLHFQCFLDLRATPYHPRHAGAAPLFAPPCSEDPEFPEDLGPCSSPAPATVAQARIELVAAADMASCHAAELEERSGTDNWLCLLRCILKTHVSRSGSVRVRYPLRFGRGKVQVRIVDVNGIASTRRSRDLVDRLRRKLGEGFEEALADRRSSKSRAVRERLLVAGAWLFGAVPAPVHDYVVNELT